MRSAHKLLLICFSVGKAFISKMIIRQVIITQITTLIEGCYINRKLESVRTDWERLMTVMEVSHSVVFWSQIIKSRPGLPKLNWRLLNRFRLSFTITFSYIGIFLPKILGLRSIFRPLKRHSRVIFLNISAVYLMKSPNVTLYNAVFIIC